MTLKNRQTPSASPAAQQGSALSRETARSDAQEAYAFDGEPLILNRYRPLETLGTGGYGTVFAAWDEQLKRRVAIKEISFEHSTSGEVAGLAEARTAALLTHPNIATVYDFVTTQNRAYLIMEFIDGVTLDEIPSEELNDDTIAAIAKPVASALEHAHKNGVLHLDVKPRNILINHDGRVKIIDFGIAELSGLKGHGAASGGTVGYMPLEQLEGELTSEKTDEWAFAAVIYELCTDEFPYANFVGDAPSFEAMLVAQQDDEPSLLQTNDAELDEIFATALATNPEERYRDVKSFSNALLKHLGDASEGRRALKAVVTELTNDEEYTEEEEQVEEKPALFTGPEIVKLLVRLLVAVIVSMSLLQLFMRGDYTSTDTQLIPIFVTLVIAGIIELAPKPGGVLACLAMSVLLIIDKAPYLWAFGLGLAIVASVSWYFLGRKSNALSLISALFAVAALEVNLLAHDWLTSTYPAVFAGNLRTINISLGVTYVLVSMVGAWILYRRKDRE